MNLSVTLTTAEFFLCLSGSFFLITTINLAFMLRKHYRKQK